MAGFRKDKTGVAQTAANTAATVTAAAITAGLISSLEDADTYFNARYAATLDSLAPIVDADNELFAQVEAAAPAARSTSRSSGGSGGGSGSSTITLESARGTALGFGKFGSKDDDGKANGVTLGELETMSKSDCEKYEYTSGNGLKYLEYLAKNENNSFIARRAQVILDARKASSADEAAA